MINGLFGAAGDCSFIAFPGYSGGVKVAAGDTNGDGTQTSGAPGQWSTLLITSAPATPSHIQYAEVRYGGQGSIAWNYGAIQTSGTAAINGSPQRCTATRDRPTNAVQYIAR